MATVWGPWTDAWGYRYRVGTGNSTGDDPPGSRVEIDGKEIPGARVISASITIPMPIFDPPSAERIPITERTNEIARRLVVDALGE